MNKSMPIADTKAGPYLSLTAFTTLCRSVSDKVLIASCIAPHDYELAGRLPLQQAREILTALKRQMMGEGNSHG